MSGASGNTDDATSSPRPMVAGRASGKSVWLFAGLAGLSAVLLFSALEARRAARSAEDLEPVQIGGQGAITPPPELVIPPVGSGEATGAAGLAASPPGSARAVPASPAGTDTQPARLPRAPLAPQGPSAFTGSSPPNFAYAPSPASGPATVFQAPVAAAPSISPAAAADSQRVKAGRFANPSLTIPKGAVIHAVLETAVDSTRPGPARALVSRDVRSFDGTRILVPRGSRLYGEYKADLTSGQNRAMIQWTRLMRPDGVTIALDSPSADPLGRAGVKGKVNSHFFARFGNALLQTLLNAGVSYTANEATGGTVILGLPGSTVAASVPQSETVRPTLKVAQGTPVSVFVARDLDFSEVEQ